MGHPAHISLTDRLRGIESEIAAGRAEGALPRCQEIATLYPRALAVQRVLGEIYLALHKPREALAALDRALTGDPEDARACCARAIIHQMHGDQVAALAWYRRACDIRPEDASLRATYREMAARLGQPSYQPGRAGLARLYLRGDLFAHAIREWETLIAENSDNTRLEAYVGLVETLWRAGRAQEAEAWARRALTNAPSCLKPLLIAAVVAHDEGRDADAEPFLRRAADLDPDHRAALALFADRLNTGDNALGALIWGETPQTDGSTSGSGGPTGAPWTRVSQGPAPTPTPGTRATQPAERRINRPLVTGEPITPGARSRPDLTTPPSTPLPPPTARPNDLPPGFHSMFKETEGMLWKPGESDPDALRGAAAPAAMPAPPTPIAQPAPQPAPLSAPAPLALDALAPPPAIAESGFALGDTEMRRAIRWVQWLQAQGARSLGDEPQRAHPSGSLDALLNSPPSAPYPAARAQPFASAPPPTPPVTALPSMPSRPEGALPSMPSGPLPSSPLPSGPLPPPSSADLRQMFAELDPDARERRGAGIVEADAVPVVAQEEASAPQASAPQAPTAPEASAPAEWSSSLADALNQLDNNAGQHMAYVTGGPVTPPAPPTPPTGNAPDATIEELDRLGEADGFMPFTLEPGALAAMTGDVGGEETRGDDWLETRSPEPSAPLPAPELPAPELPSFAPEPPAPPAVEPEPPSEPLLGSQPGAPDAHDYAARLTQARDHRDSGALDEAIVEYRTVVRNAPELLPDVLADVEGCLAERPEHPELHRLLGDARIRQGDYLGALESYNRAVALSQTLDS